MSQKLPKKLNSQILIEVDNLFPFEIVGYIRVYWYYHHGFQEVVTSAHFVKIKTILFAKLLGFEPRSVGASQVFSAILCPLSYRSLGVNNCVIVNSCLRRIQGAPPPQRNLILSFRIRFHRKAPTPEVGDSPPSPNGKS